MKIFIVTYCPAYAEYSNQISLRKAFANEFDAEKYIEEEKQKERKQVGDDGWIGEYEIEEMDLEEAE